MDIKKTIYIYCLSVLLISLGFIAKVEAISITTYYGSTNSTNTEGNRQLAQIQGPRDMLEDSSGNLYVLVSNRIGKIDSNFNLTFIAGNSTGDQDGIGRNANFNIPMAFAMGPREEYIYIADTRNHKIKRLNLSSLQVSTIAGSTSGNSVGPALSAQFNDPEGIAVGSDGTIYVSDTDNRRIKTISADLTTVSYYAGSGSKNRSDNEALSAGIVEPIGLAFNSLGELHVADRGSHSIRKIYNNNGVLSVSTVLGDGNAGDSIGEAANVRLRNPRHIFFDASDQMYITDTENNKLKLLNSSNNVVTLAGLGQSEEGYRDGDANTALLNDPFAAILRSDNTLLIADKDNHSLRRVDLNGTYTEPAIKTLAGNSSSGSTDGKFGLNKLKSPRGLAYDSTGNLYIADTGNHVIRVLSTDGTLSTFAGTGSSGSTDGNSDVASFNEPYDIVIDSSDNLYVSDRRNRKIRKITPAGLVSTFAGSGSSGAEDATGTSASFKNIEGMCIDSSNNIYVVDTSNFKIRMINPSAEVTTIAGKGSRGSENGPGSLARFNTPTDIAVNSEGELFVTDTANHSIRKIEQKDSNWIVSTFAGGTGSGFHDASGGEARFNSPHGIDIDSTGNIFVSDTGNNRIRKISSIGEVTTVAGTGHARFTDGNKTVAAFRTPEFLVLNNTGDIVVADTSNSRIRSIASSVVNASSVEGSGSNNVQTLKVVTVAGTSTSGFRDGAARLALFNKPYGLTKDSKGNIYIADRSNNVIRKFNTRTNTVTIYAGIQGSSGSQDGNALTEATFKGPTGLDFDSAGNLYVAEYDNHRIRKISSEGVVSTVAGTGSAGFTDGASDVARFRNPFDVKVGPDNRLYVADYSNNRIRVIESNGSVSTYVGANGSGDSNGPRSSAQLRNPTGLSFDSKGDLFVSDLGNGKIKKISSDNVTTVAGSGTRSFADGQGQSAQLKAPFHLDHDKDDNLYFADTGNNRIRRVSPSGLVKTIAGTGLSGNQDGTVDEALIYNPRGLIINNQNEVVFSVSDNHTIKKITTNVIENRSSESSGPILVVPTGNLTPIIALVTDLDFDESNVFRVREGTDLSLKVFAYDVEDGLEIDEQVTWVSNNQGILGTGMRYNTNQLSLGLHNIIVRVLDSSGAQARTSFAIEVVGSDVVLSDGNGADRNGDGTIDEEDEDRNISEQGTNKTIVHIISPRKSRVQKRKARLKAVALNLDSNNAVSGSNDDEIIWEAIFIDPDAELQEGVVPDRVFLQEGRKVRLGRLAPGLYSIFARHNDIETKINVTIDRNSVSIGSISAESTEEDDFVTKVFYGLD